MSYTEIDETAAGLTLGTQSASKVGFYAATPASRPANTVVARTALQNLGLLASGGTDTTVYTTGNNTLSGANTLSGNNTISGANTISGDNTFSGANTLSGNNTISGANTISGNNTFSGANSFTTNNQTITDVNLVLGTATGTKIGTSVSQKLGFWNATPVVQPVGASQAALGAVTTIGDNTGTPAAGLSLIGNTTSVDQAAALMNDLASLREDLDAAFTLINALRTALVDVGIVKGAA